MANTNTDNGSATVARDLSRTAPRLLVILAAVAITGCTSSKPRLVDLAAEFPSYEDAIGDDTASLYLVHLDLLPKPKGSLAQKTASHITIDGQRMPEPTGIWTKNARQLKSPLSLRAGEHAFNLQGQRWLEKPRITGGPSVSSESHSAIMPFSQTVDAGDAYALVTYWTKEGKYRWFFRRIGKANSLGETPPPRPNARIKMGAWHIGYDIALAWHKVRQAIVKKK